MLKISIQDDLKTVALKLEGKLIGPWVEELNRVWLAFQPSVGAKTLFVDLRGMTFADENGIRTLRKIVGRTDVRILADTPLTRHFAAESMRKIRQVDQKEI